MPDFKIYLPTCVASGCYETEDLFLIEERDPIGAYGTGRDYQYRNYLLCDKDIQDWERTGERPTVFPKDARGFREVCRKCGYEIPGMVCSRCWTKRGN